jgi:hypothetical protein
MPIPNIIVFNTKYANDLITEFEGLGFNPFYNNKADYYWLKSELPEGRHKLYWLYDNELYDADNNDIIHGEMEIMPAFCIVFTDEVEAEVWGGIKNWLRIEVFSFCDNGMFKTDEHLKIDEFMTRPEKDIKYYEPEGEDIVYEGLKGKCLTTIPEDDRPKYTWRCKYIASNDTKYYEVTRSNTKLPFTIVIPSFSTKDESWFFTDIYGSNDWDYNRIDCKYDFQFLCNLWNKIGMAGKFNMELVKNRVDSCYIERIPKGQVPCAEPIIYRRDMDDVISASLKRKNAEFLPEFVKKV